MAPDPQDPYENTIFQTLSSGEIGNTVPVPGGEPTVAAGDVEDATLPVSEADAAYETAPVTADGPGVSAPRPTRPTETIVRTGGGTVDALGLAPGEGPVPLERNRRIGNYRLDAQVGRGGQGEVWLGENVLAGKKVALKFLHEKLAHDEQAMADLRGEAGVLFDLTNDRIVRLMNIEQGGGHAFLVMEFLGGPSVQDVFKRRREQHKRGLEVEECLWVLDEIAQALDYANAEGVTHRDIKPANMMLTEPVDDDTPLHESGARVKLCDFGIAFTANKSMAQKGEFDPIGTLPFMAPEVLMRRQPTPAADIYSLAATLYYLVKGEPPVYGREAPRELIQRIKTEVPPPLGSGDAAFDAALRKALSKDPEERQASADQLLQEASGGRMGRVAQKKAKTVQAVVVTALLMALAAGTYITLRFATQSTQVEDWSLADGYVTSEPSVLAEFRLDNVDVNEVAIGFVGGEFKTIGRSQQGFAEYVPTPEGDGPHTLEVRDPETGRSFGTRRIVVDKTLVAGADDVQALERGPYEIDAGVDLRFEFEEPVTLHRYEGGEPVELDLERSGNVLTGHLAFVDTAASLAAADPTRPDLDAAHTMRFLAEDAAGNRATFEHAVEVYDGQALARYYADRFPLPEDTDQWHPWRYGEMEEALDLWEADLADPRIAEAREDVRTGGPRGQLASRLRSLVAKLPPVTHELYPEPAVEHELASETRLHTRERSYTLNGRIVDSRSGTVTLTEAGGEPVELDLDESTGDFRHLVTLEEGEERELRLSANSMTPVVVRVVHDDEPPAVDVDVEPRSKERAVPVRARVEDDWLAAVWVEDAAGGRTPLALREDGAWGAEAVPLAPGENELAVVAVDRAGNRTRRTARVEVDETGPTVEAVAPESVFRTGLGFTTSLRLSEQATVREAAFEFIELDGTPTPFDVPPDLRTDGLELSVDGRIPDRPGQGIRIRIDAEDAVGNPRTAELTYGVEYDPWGLVPDAIRAEAVPVGIDAPGLAAPLPEWALAQEDWGDGYVYDGGRRYPRCIRHRETGIELLYVPSGTFELGSPYSANPEAQSVHEVRMSGFYVGRTEVSVEQYLRGRGEHVNVGPEEAREPRRILFLDAEEWCAPWPFRLPTEAQWEYAASGPENHDFPWGPRFDRTLVNSKPSDGPGTRDAPLAPVDAFPDGRSWCGAVQMAGNLYEFCRDRLDFGNVAPVDPVGAVGGDATEKRVLRGGSRGMFAQEKLRTDFRFAEESQVFPRNGFRVVWELD